MPPTIVITGATSGLGRLAAIALAKQGVHLGITARSQQRADATRTEIQAAAPGTLVDIFLGDFARMDDADTTSFTARGSSTLYGKSKLLDIMFTLELARRLEGTGVAHQFCSAARTSISLTAQDCPSRRNWSKMPATHFTCCR